MGALAGGEAAAGFVAGAGAALAVLVALANFMVDPYQRYRTPRWYRPYYTRPRYTNPGLARTQEYDTALLGSSVIESTSCARVEAHLGGRCLKLPMSSASARELALLLSAVLRAGKARRVLLALDPFACRGDTRRLGHGRKMPVALYSPGAAGHLVYLANVDTLAASLKVLRRSWAGGERRQFDLERYGSEEGTPVFSREAVLADWRAGAPGRVQVRCEHDARLLAGNARTHLVPLLAGHPGTAFWVILPPYSALLWADNLRKGVLEDALAFRRSFFEAACHFPNVRIFDFQADEVVTDLDQYRDVVHYGAGVSERILGQMAAGQGILTPESLEESERRLRALAEEGARTA